MNRTTLTLHGLRVPTPAALIGIALLGLGLTPPGGADELQAQAVELRWGMEAGEEYIYRMAQEGRSEMGAMGEMRQLQELTMRKEVLEVTGNGHTDLRVSYESVRHEQDGPMGSQSYDSEEDEAPAEGELAIMAALMDQSFELTMDPLGDVTHVHGMEGFVAEMAETVTEGVGDPQAAQQAREVLEGTFGDEGMASLMQQGIQTLPAQAVEVGDTWTEDLSVPTPMGTVDSEYDYELVELLDEGAGTVARIEFEGRLEGISPDEAGDGPMAQMAALVEGGEGDVEGYLLFNVDRGILVRTVVESTMMIEAMGQQIDVSNHHEMELVEGL